MAGISLLCILKFFPYPHISLYSHIVSLYSHILSLYSHLHPLFQNYSVSNPSVQASLKNLTKLYQKQVSEININFNIYG